MINFATQTPNMNIVITGAARGIGKAIAIAFAKKGDNIIFCARNQTGVDKAAEEIKQANANVAVFGFVADLSSKTDVQKFADFCLSKGEAGVLVNNAGGFTPGNILTEPDNALENMINNNLYSAYYLTRAIAPKMLAAGKGHIFNICSIASLKAYEAGGSYSISKYAMNGFSQNLRHELRSTHVKVTTVYPGAVFTDSWGDFDNSENRIMVADDVAQMIVACTTLSPAAVPEEIVLRPQLGDL
jgi:short-subunit dehydrogenase